MEASAQILHGRKDGLSADDRTDKELLQGHYPQNECEGIRAQQDKPNQGFRIQVCCRNRQMDKNFRNAQTEHLYRKQGL